MKTDIEIAQDYPPLAIDKIADKLNLPTAALIRYGENKAKVKPDLVTSDKNGKIILVTSINPTPFGEGKSTTVIGLVDGLAKLNKSVMGALREPSMGPVFGIKGGAAGGGHAQVNPMEDINLHFTGDLHAITSAHNLISAILDNHLFNGNALNIDVNNIAWPRAMDMNDRALRKIKIAYSKDESLYRDSSFVITVASEIMAILCLATSLNDFKNRVAKVVVAYDINQKPVTVADLKIVGAIATIMKDALYPNLVQTLEHNPIFIHGGPFANIAHGNNSIIATKLATRLADYVVTEAGFGADLGAEKFFNIKCRFGKLKPSAVVIVVTLKALKLHGGIANKNITLTNPEAVALGLDNLRKHIETVTNFNSPFVIALNRFNDDTEEEIAVVADFAKKHNYPYATCNAWAEGGAGAVELAEMVVKAIDKPVEINHTYDLKDPIEKKLNLIATKVYGAQGIEFSETALKQLALIKENNWDDLAVCVAKTPLSLTDNPKIKGRPRDFMIHVSELRVSAGAGFVVALTGSVMTMPGLPKIPSAENIDINDLYQISGLF